MGKYKELSERVERLDKKTEESDELIWKQINFLKNIIISCFGKRKIKFIAFPNTDEVQELKENGYELIDKNEGLQFWLKR